MHKFWNKYKPEKEENILKLRIWKGVDLGNRSPSQEITLNNPIMQIW
jgi:hypothetical protein